jgi:hypothetical protein
MTASRSAVRHDMRLSRENAPITDTGIVGRNTPFLLPDCGKNICFYGFLLTGFSKNRDSWGGWSEGKSNCKLLTLPLAFTCLTYLMD